MIRRILAGAVLAGATAAVSAVAVPAYAEPGPGPLAGTISEHTCRAGGGTPLYPPFQQIGPVSTGICLGGEYTLAAVPMPRGGKPGLL